MLSAFTADTIGDEVDDQPATMFVVGRIWTADSRRPIAEAVAVRDDRIVAVGSRNALERFRGKKTQVIDAGGGIVVPGLIDSHIHLIDGGLQLASVSLRRTKRRASGSRAVIGTIRCGAASCRRAIGSMQ